RRASGAASGPRGSGTRAPRARPPRPRQQRSWEEIYAPNGPGAPGDLMIVNSLGQIATKTVHDHERGESPGEAGVGGGGGWGGGGGPPVLRLSRAVTASFRVRTLTRRRPAGTAPLVSAQLAAGVRKTVAPALRAPIIFCWMPPMGSTFPLASISPVPAMNLPPVRSLLVS